MEVVSSKTLEYLVTHETLEPKNITNLDGETKIVPGTGGDTGKAEQKYGSIPLMYNFQNEKGEVQPDSFLYETPPLTSDFGISSMEKGKYNVRVVVRPGDVNGQIFKEDMDKIYYRNVEILQAQREARKVVLKEFKPTEPTSLYRKPIDVKRDDLSNEPIPGKHPEIYLKLNYYENKAKDGSGKVYVNKSKFELPDGTEVDWNILTNAKITFVAVLHIRSIYVGPKASTQIVLKRAIVTNISPADGGISQIKTRQQLMQQQPDLMDKLQRQIACLTTSKQDQMVPPKVPSFEPKDETEDAPTFSGLESDTIDMSAISSMANDIPSFN